MADPDKPIAPQSNSITTSDLGSTVTETPEQNLSPFPQEFINFLSPDIVSDLRNYQEFTNFNDCDQISQEPYNDSQKYARKLPEVRNRKNIVDKKIDREQSRNFQFSKQKAQIDEQLSKNIENYEEICGKQQIPLLFGQKDIDFIELEQKINQNLGSILGKLYEYAKPTNNEIQLPLNFVQPIIYKEITGLLNNISTLNCNYQQSSIEQIKKNKLKRSLLIQCYKPNNFLEEPHQFKLRKRQCSYQFKNRIQRTELISSLITKTKNKPSLFNIKRKNNYFDVKGHFIYIEQTNQIEKISIRQGNISFPLNYGRGLSNCIDIQEYQRYIREWQERAEEYDCFQAISKLYYQFPQIATNKKQQLVNKTVTFDRVGSFKSYIKNRNPIEIRNISENYEILHFPMQTHRKFIIQELQSSKVDFYIDIQLINLDYCNESINSSNGYQEYSDEFEGKDNYSREGGSDLT